MLESLIRYSVRHKPTILLLVAVLVVAGVYSLSGIQIGAVPDVTNNQVQIITTSRNLSTEDVERYLTYPVELEMANLPGVTEIRSISKFGLSVVTVVFEDRMGAYLPRQLIAERLALAEESIPKEFGTPFMGPISTGLGEIYQYILDVEPAYKDRYSLTDLRTIQDWIVSRQLSGIPGVIEVNTWGGHLKQYEVSVDPERMKALDISLSEVIASLESQNQVAGGAYVERFDEAIFIRGDGLIGSLEDIESVVVANRGARPVRIRDVADVGFGHAVRFGAITGNGEGEKVLGQVMMLKGANSKEVIDAVRARVEEISDRLPPGVFINPVVDRSELIGRTSFTIAENLVFGSLIVIFVVVLLLGNLRSGLVVASVIPLSLLFALTLMRAFGIDANLMSLGAIDFGIIIDGAVIIVEYIVYRISSQFPQLKGLSPKERQERIDRITEEGGAKMMHAAVFGQLIIMIVFIPVFTLSGVEGKMFIPMALVFVFALLGTMLLCFTYVPVMAALFIRPVDPERKRLPSDRIIGLLQRMYHPSILLALRRKGLVLGAAAALLASSVWLFTRMGAEFVPTLDEGDFVIQPVLRTGTSLGETIRIMTEIETLLLDFPEVNQVVSRIGAAEVPTDPMSMEETDVIITLHPPSTWTTASTKDGLAEAFSEALSVIPGVDYEFTQPIEMRFNELITGVRSDLAIKVFGEDLDILYDVALQIEAAIRGVEGASDIVVEKVAGLPQMTVRYDRERLARHGVRIDDLNALVSTAFAGRTVGAVFEGERQFDLVVRYGEGDRADPDALGDVMFRLPNGTHLPLRELAVIEESKGPAKISRDDTRRRVVVGVNVRDRDLQSVVDDVHAILDERIALPPGYSITYGGQFENLQTASQRLRLAVPVSLALIFAMLYFAFHSARDAAIIFSAIPLAAVGGVWLLYLRGMPFSISAGVGFIALFGIAVLNGIVLMEEFRSLKERGITNIHRRILMGTRNRMRPVLITATAAAMGFLPMAVSTSSGAEVQRPLATVVIGGIFTATILTLIVLPVLYALVEKRFGSRLGGRSGGGGMPGLLLVALLSAGLLAQAEGDAMAQTAPARPVSMEEAIRLSLAANRGLQAERLRTEQSLLMRKGAFDPGRASIEYGYDESNRSPQGDPFHVFGISQPISLPTRYLLQSRVLGASARVQQHREEGAQLDMRREVSSAYQLLLYHRERVRLLSELDSLYARLSRAERLRFESGGSARTEFLMAQTQRQQNAIRLNRARTDVELAENRLNAWVQAGERVTARKEPLQPRPPSSEWSVSKETHPRLLERAETVELRRGEYGLRRHEWLPDLQAGYMHSSTPSVTGSDAYHGFYVGISVPLLSSSTRTAVRSAEARVKIAQTEYEQARIEVEHLYERLRLDLARSEQELNAYRETALPMAGELKRTALLSHDLGEIGILELTQIMDRAANVELDYLDRVILYNLLAVEAETLPASDLP